MPMRHCVPARSEPGVVVEKVMMSCSEVCQRYTLPRATIAVLMLLALCVSCQATAGTLALFCASICPQRDITSVATHGYWWGASMAMFLLPYSVLWGAV